MSGPFSRNKSKYSIMSETLMFVGKAVVGGLALYGAKRLCDDLMGSGRKRTHAGADQLSLTDSDPNIEELDDSPLSESNSSLVPSPSRKPLPSLKETIEDYLVTCVEFPESTMSLAKQVVEEVAQDLEEFFKVKSSSMISGKLKPYGSAYDDLKVISPNRFSILLPLSLESTHWELMDGKDTLLNAPGYWLVKRINLDFFPSGKSPWDAEGLVGGYLSPLRVRELFRSKLESGLNGTAAGKYSIYPSMLESQLSVTVEYSSANRRLVIDIMPCLVVEDRNLIALSHGKASFDELSGYGNLWREAFIEEENERVHNLAEVLGDNSCHRECLRILKTAATDKRTSLGIFDSYILKTVWFHFQDEDTDWSRENLPKRFVDLVNELDTWLQIKCLPHYFNKDVNLFLEYPDHQLNHVRDYIASIVDRKEYVKLLLAS